MDSDETLKLTFFHYIVKNNNEMSGWKRNRQ